MFVLFTKLVVHGSDEEDSKLIRRLGQWQPTPRPTWNPTRMFILFYFILLPIQNNTKQIYILKNIPILNQDYLFV